MATIDLQADNLVPLRAPPALRPLAGIRGASLGIASFATGGPGERGGDFCNVTALPGLRWLFAVGDVEGKGAMAALAVAQCRGTLRAAAESGAAPHEIVARLNDALTDADRLAAARPCAVCVVSVRACADGFAGRVCNSGNPLPVVVRANGDLDALGGPGMVAGYFPEDTWNDWTFNLAPGDTLIVCTDGVADSRSRSRFYGHRRLESAARELAARHRGDGPAIAEGLIARARHFALPRQPPDDMLVLALSIPHAALAPPSDKGARREEVVA